MSCELGKKRMKLFIAFIWSGQNGIKIHLKRDKERRGLDRGSIHISWVFCFVVVVDCFSCFNLFYKVMFGVAVMCFSIKWPKRLTEC